MMIANAQNTSDKLSGPEFFHELSAFAHKHEAAINMDDAAVGRYIKQEFGAEDPDLQDHPDIIKFTTLQDSLAGRSVGRDGLYSFKPEENDASMGPETERQRLKRLKREEWFRRFIEALKTISEKYEDTYNMLKSAKEAVKKAKEEIDSTLKDIRADYREINEAIQKGEKPEKYARRRALLQSYETLLKHEREDTEEFEQQVLNPIEDKLNNSAPTEEELDNIQRKIYWGIPTIAWRIYDGLLNKMKNKFNSFPRLKRRDTNIDLTPSFKPISVPQAKPVAKTPTAQTPRSLVAEKDNGDDGNGEDEDDGSAKDTESQPESQDEEEQPNLQKT